MMQKTSYEHREEIIEKINSDKRIFFNERKTLTIRGIGLYFDSVCGFKDSIFLYYKNWEAFALLSKKVFINQLKRDHFF
jgi:hypothetical protein